MTPGTVVSWKGFTFYDGQQADKLLVVLNAGGSDPYLVLRTTSQQKGRLAHEGCHSAAGFYFLPARRDGFLVNTWILLYESYELEATKFLKAKFEGDAKIAFGLKEQTLRAIINCFLKSDDCSEHHRKLLR